MRTIIILTSIWVLMSCGGNQEQVVKSPFSHLDTVKTKKVETEEPIKKKDDGTSFSPFDNIKK